MVESYYKAIDTHDHVDLNVDNEELSIVPLLEYNSSSTEVNQE
jgi:hypothetical protein